MSERKYIHFGWSIRAYDQGFASVENSQERVPIEQPRK